MGLAWALAACAGASPERPAVEQEPAKKASPQEIEAWRSRGLKHFEEGDYRAARDVLKKAWTSAGKDLELTLALGEAALFVDDEASALASLRHAIALAPEHPRAHVLCAVAETLAGEGESWRRTATRAVELRADILEALLEDADRLDAAKARKATVAALEVATMIAPNELRAHVRLAAALEGAGRNEEAASKLEAAARTVGKSAVMFRQAAALWTKAGNAQKATELDAIANQLDPPEPDKKMRPLQESRRK